MENALRGWVVLLLMAVLFYGVGKFLYLIVRNCTQLFLEKGWLKSLGTTMRGMKIVRYALW